MSALSRRTFLGIGAGVGLGLTTRVGPLLAVPSRRRKRRGVIWLWMDGGMCQGHTWDPKPADPFSCQVKAIKTGVPGIHVSELLPICAAQMNHLTIIRSLSHGFGQHDLATQVMQTGEFSGVPAELPPIGTILAHELGAKDFPLPHYVSIGGPAVPESSLFGLDCIPFRLNWNGAPSIPNLRRNVAAARDKERAALLLEQNRDWDSQRQQLEIARLEHAAIRSEDLMNTPLLKVFNLEEEPAALRAEYGEGFGQQCLLARRLVATGCPFVEIGLGGWGRHACAAADYRQLVRTLDQGLGTLVKDLAQKGLLSETLVVCATAFGKPPQSRINGGNTWSNGFSVVLAGGFLPGGIVYGDTGPEGNRCTSPVPVKDFFATIYSACGLDWEKEYLTETKRKKKYASGGKPLEPLF